MSRIHAAMLAVVLGAVCGCAPSFNGKWTGTGEIGEAGFFSFEVNLDGRSPAGRFEFRGQPGVGTPVCRIVEQDGHVEFVLASSGSAADCATLALPLTFVGDFGRDVATGMVLDRSDSSGERLVGLFRAFRDRSGK